MLARFSCSHGRLAWAPWPRRASLVALLAAVVACALLLAAVVASSVPGPIAGASGWLLAASVALGAAALAVLAASAAYSALCGDAARIEQQVRERLYSAYLGNPLGLSDGDELPDVSCKADGDGYVLTVSTTSATAERVAEAAPSVSAALTGRLSSLAVVSAEQDPASRHVRFVLRDMASDRSLAFRSVEEMRPADPTRLAIQRGLDLDLTAARSVIVSGRTRSGKTTAVIGLLSQVLLAGPDEWGSSVVVVDGKGAELAAVGALALDEDGTAHGILAAMRSFERSRAVRQAHLNDLARATGDAVKWWDDSAGMRPSYLFIDEYLALRSILPAKASKDDPRYCLAEFDGIVQRIATMGASAGCFLVISVAQASVGAGGVPTMLAAACGTRLLFRPTVDDGAFLWPREALDVLPSRSYGPGEAWFSCDDGEHASPMTVRFPRLDFPAYAEFGRLLREYGD